MLFHKARKSPHEVLIEDAHTIQREADEQMEQLDRTMTEIQPALDRLDTRARRNNFTASLELAFAGRAASNEHTI